MQTELMVEIYSLCLVRAIGNTYEIWLEHQLKSIKVTKNGLRFYTNSYFGGPFQKHWAITAMF